MREGDIYRPQACAGHMIGYITQDRVAGGYSNFYSNLNSKWQFGKLEQALAPLLHTLQHQIVPYNYKQS